MRPLLAQAFESEDEVALVEALYDDSAYIPELDLVAELEAT